MKRTPLKRKTPLRSRKTALGSTKRTKSKTTGVKAMHFRIKLATTLF